MGMNAQGIFLGFCVVLPFLVELFLKHPEKG
jgi:hypothetical protein